MTALAHRPTEEAEHPSVREARSWLTSSQRGDLLTERARLVVAYAKRAPDLEHLSAFVRWVWGGSWEPTGESGAALLTQARAYLGETE